MVAQTALEHVGFILAVGGYLQTREIRALSPLWQKSGPWGLDVAERELDVSLLARIISDRNLGWVLYAMLWAYPLAGLFGFYNLFGFLFVTELLVLLRFRGHVNGAADSLKLYVLLALFLAHSTEALITKQVCLCLIAFLCLWSYFRSGLAKWNQRRSQNGSPMMKMLLADYARPPNSQIFTSLLIFFDRHVLVVLQVLAPFIVFFPHWLFYGMLTGLLFHLINVRLFGLHRFLWTWLACYPAIQYVSLNVNNVNLLK